MKYGVKKMYYKYLHDPIELILKMIQLDVDEWKHQLEWGLVVVQCKQEG
jgi:hypothetical protein